MQLQRPTEPSGPAQTRTQPLSEAAFYSQYVAHVDIQARGGLNNVLAIFEHGFKPSQNVNTLPPYRGGKPTNVIEAKYAPRKGDVVYLVPKKFTRETGNGPAVEEGWIPQPHEVVIASEDQPAMYQEYLKTFRQPAPAANGAAFGQLHHGTAKEFKEFSPPIGRRRGGGYDHQGPGFYLTSDTGFGRFFARTAASLADDDYYGDGVVMDLQLKPETKILDLRRENVDTLARLLFKDSTVSKKQGQALRARVQSLGYDGVAFTEPNFPEGWNVDTNATTVVVYEPSLVAIPGAGATDVPPSSGGKARMPVTVDMIGRNSVRAFAGKRIVGGASAWEDSRGAFVILKAEVKEPYRRRGIATAMYKAIEEAAGKNLVPAVSLSDDAFEFWKSFRPEAVAKDLRHRKEELVGEKAVKNGRLGTILKASGGIATMRFDDAEEGAANSQTFIHRDELDAAIAAAALLTHHTNYQAFKNWFGPSVVTENNLPGGKPLVVFHGTRDDIVEVDTGRSNRLPGFWVTPYASLASTYAAEGVVNASSYREGANVMPVYAKIDRPYRFDPRKKPMHMAWQEYQAGDYDGFIETGADAQGITTMAVRSGNQIKSATGNNGNFDSEVQDIRFSVPDEEDGQREAPSP